MDDGYVKSDEDHPRGCGEHNLTDIFLGLDGGSSPRMRGALHHVVQRRSEHGIIPADAGSTIRDDDGGAYLKDHPRGCGEH